MNIPEQKPWDINTISEIRCQFFLSPANGREYADILTVRFYGRYRVGCQGGPDATYMEAMTSAALVATQPKGLVFDFTELDYSWGDDLEKVYSVVSDWPYRGADLPFAVLLGDECREAIISLECGTGGLQEPAEWMFDTFAEAWHYVNERIRP